MIFLALCSDWTEEHSAQTATACGRPVPPTSEHATSAENIAGKHLHWGFQIMQDLGMKGRERKTKSDAVNLCWVITDDHDEDWFILAPRSTRSKTLPH
jgi:hypothetical protein